MTAEPALSEEYLVHDEPYYAPVGDEVALFEAAYRHRLPLLLKGPTGCGKTRFVVVDQVVRLPLKVADSYRRLAI